MIWDKLFWVCFIAAGILAIFILYAELSLASLLLGLVLIGTGFCKLSQESREEKRLSRRIINRLKKGI
jgi:Flp pilus assembly protein TadB